MSMNYYIFSNKLISQLKRDVKLLIKEGALSTDTKACITKSEVSVGHIQEGDLILSIECNICEQPVKAVLPVKQLYDLHTDINISVEELCDYLLGEYIAKKNSIMDAFNGD